MNGTGTKLFQTIVPVTMTTVCRYMTTDNLFFYQKMTIVTDPENRQVALSRAFL